MQTSANSPWRMRAAVRAVLLFAVAALFVRVFLGILWEYRWYLPPDFENSSFLSGRRSDFTAMYATAFYAHLASGPLALVLGGLSLATAVRSRWRPWHPTWGRLQAFVAPVLIASGLIMARVAYGGPIARAGFLGLSAATGWCFLMAVRTAGQGRLAEHRRWAVRLLLLLSSPLLLRVLSGLAIVSGWESPATYQLNAWVSWILPLLVWEVRLGWSSRPIAHWGDAS